MPDLTFWQYLVLAVVIGLSFGIGRAAGAAWFDRDQMILRRRRRALRRLSA